MRVSDKWVKEYSTGQGWDPVTKELALDLGEARAELAGAQDALNRYAAERGKMVEARALSAEASATLRDESIAKNDHISALNGLLRRIVEKPKDPASWAADLVRLAPPLETSAQREVAK